MKANRVAERIRRITSNPTGEQPGGRPFFDDGELKVAVAAASDDVLTQVIFHSYSQIAHHPKELEWAFKETTWRMWRQFMKTSRLSPDELNSIGTGLAAYFMRKRGASKKVWEYITVDDSSISKDVYYRRYRQLSKYVMGEVEMKLSEMCKRIEELTKC